MTLFTLMNKGCSIILNQALVTAMEQIWFSWALTNILFTNMYNFINEEVGYLDPSCLHTIAKNLHNISKNDINDNSSIFLLRSNFIIHLHASNSFQHHVSFFSLKVVDCWTIWFPSTSSNAWNPSMQVTTSVEVLDSIGSTSNSIGTIVVRPS